MLMINIVLREQPPKKCSLIKNSNFFLLQTDEWLSNSNSAKMYKLKAKEMLRNSKKKDIKGLKIFEMVY